MEFPTPDLESLWRSTSSAAPPSEVLADELEELLNEPADEASIQEYFERYPQLLPGMDRFHHGPRGDAVISKLPLGTDFITDFAFVSANSQYLCLTCVELESPKKKLFTRGASFSRSYLDARQQVTDWNYWAQQHLRGTLALFSSLGKWTNFMEVTLRCILVVGRRDELSTRKRLERWSAEYALKPSSIDIMTYDRVLEQIRSGWHWTSERRMLVCSYRDRSLMVKSLGV